jgi:hypothetical protein
MRLNRYNSCLNVSGVMNGGALVDEFFACFSLFSNDWNEGLPEAFMPCSILQNFRQEPFDLDRVRDVVWPPL